MKKYVCGFMKDSYDRLALVRKNKPQWQAGKLNGIGGGIDDDEAPHHAMIREWQEETSSWYCDWIRFAQIQFPETIVHFFKAEVYELQDFPEVNDIGELIEVHNYASAVRFTDMIPNLKWLLPMAFEDPDAGFVRSTPWQRTNDNAPPATQVAA